MTAQTADVVPQVPLPRFLGYEFPFAWIENLLTLITQTYTDWSFATLANPAVLSDEGLAHGARSSLYLRTSRTIVMYLGTIIQKPVTRLSTRSDAWY